MADLEELIERVERLKRQAQQEVAGLHREWPHHAEQARRSAREMLDEARALECQIAALKETQQ